jgi:opacity protein-like surface antigen
MKNVILAFGLLVFSAVFAAAQTTTTLSDDYKKAEFYVGYSNGQVDTGIDSGNSVNSFFRDRKNFHGVNVSGVYNLSRYFGVKGDVSGTYNNSTFVSSIVQDQRREIDTRNSLYNFVGGVQVKDNSNSGSFKPFAHAMVGGAHARSKITDVRCDVAAICDMLPGDTVSDTGFAGVFGGGLDFRLNDHFQIRAIQVDYNPVRSFGQWDQNLRIGAGIVF